MKKTILYLSGPITGHDIQKVKDNFQEYEDKFTDEDYNVLNPLKLIKRRKNKTWFDYLKECIIHLLKADVIAAMPGWNQSNGCMLELYIASKLGIKIIDAQTQKLLMIECPPPYKRKPTEAEIEAYKLQLVY